jgi:outer membrane protein assembly factor BamB
VLIAESTLRQVTERNFKGEVLWVYDAPGYLVGARRLRNGRTVVITHDEVIDLDREGKEVSRLPCPNGGSIAAAVRLPNRQTAMITNTGEFTLFDARGQSIRTFDINGRIHPTACGIEMLPNGNVLVPLYYAGQIVEVDPTGKTVWQAPVAFPTSVQRLPNGNTLVASLLGQDVVEVDKDGKIVADLSANARLQRASRR